MFKVDMSLVKHLRQATGLSMKETVKALTASNNDLEGAKSWLRKNVKAKVSDLSAVKEGCVGSYVHYNNQAAGLVLLACNTDFTGRNAEFVQLANDLALHITSSAPRWISVEDVPKEIVTAEREIFEAQALNLGRPAHLIDKIVQGMLNRFYEDNVLLQQRFVKDGRLIQDMLDEMSAKTGETVLVKQISVCRLGK